MANAAPADPGFEARVRASFGRQRFMTTLGATLERVAPGEVEIRLPFRGDLTQQHGFLHAGAMTAAVDSACGYAALSLMPTGAAVLTVEFKVNLLAPGEGESFLARGRVVKPGRTLMVCTGDLVTSRAGVERSLVTMLATVMVVRERKGLVD
jgi:uncharacterized protein (TIGR00369 family)